MLNAGLSRRSLMVATAASAFVAATPAILRAKTLRWVGASNAAMSDTTAQAFDFFAERVTELTSGQITSDRFHGDALGDDRDHVEGILQGTIQFAAPGAPLLSGWFNQADIFVYPYVFRDVGHKDRAMTAIIDDFSERMLETVPLRILGAIPRMGRHITSNTTIVTPADIKGLKIRTPQTPMWVKAFEKFGAAPTPLPFPEVFSSLQTRVIDGQENPLATSFQNGLFAANKKLALSEHMFADNVVVIGNSVYSSLDDAQRATLHRAAREMEDEFRPKVQAGEADLIEKVKAEEVEVNEVDKQAFAATVTDLHLEFPHVTEWVKRIHSIA
ncbi:TRAP transporter substrate-binding protein [Shinella sp. S4-D37]|uniref:TRAP transporter substrate-binding protein n=1 Tax=Shinella sp. S4-D37 TaxID=3161999 RepID=UPI00346598BA